MEGTDISSQKVLDRAAVALDVRELSIVSNWRGTFAIAVQWAVIIGAILCAVLSHHWLAYVAAILIVATRQHALGVLAHEATHYRLFSNRVVNDVASDLLAAFPLGISTRFYREHHLRHHNFVNTDRDPDRSMFIGDPDWSWPKLPFECVKLFIRDLIGLNVRVAIALMRVWSPAARLSDGLGKRSGLYPHEWLLLLAFYGIVALGLTATGCWLHFALLWIVPELTVFTAIFRVRALAEHYGLPSEHELNDSRCVKPIWWERFLFAPCNVNYHLEHHLFPSVPFYNLPRLHARLMREQSFADNSHRTDSYTGLIKGVLAELLKTSGEIKGDPGEWHLLKP